jgi:hypothetical protein
MDRSRCLGVRSGPQQPVPALEGPDLHPQTRIGETVISLFGAGRRMSKRHTEAQIIAALKQVEAGRTVDDVARECGVSQATIYA